MSRSDSSGGISPTVTPLPHFLNWQLDPHSNYLARIVFPEPTRSFQVEVDLVAEMTVINPFDFFLEPSANKFPFQYDTPLAADLKPFLNRTDAAPQQLAVRLSNRYYQAKRSSSYAAADDTFRDSLDHTTC